MVRIHRGVIRRCIWLTWFFCLAATGIAFGQKLTLKELARVNGGKATTRVTVNGSFGSWQRVVGSAEIIVHGQITSVQPRLTKDDDNVLTYISLAPLEFLKGTHTEVRPSKPGFTSGIVFVHGGGKVVVDGLELTVINEAAPEPALQVGEQVIAFLTPMGSEPGVFILAYSTFGLVRVQGDRVVNGSPRINKTRPIDSSNLADFLGKIRGLLRNTAK